MSRTSTPHTPNARFDYLVVSDGKAATVELKRAGDGLTSYWWVTGLNASGKLVNLYQMQLSLPSLSEKDLGPLIQAMLTDFAFPLAHIASKSNTSSVGAQLFEPQFRQKLASAHLEIHDELGNLGDANDGVLLRTAREFELADSLGVSTVVEFLASYEQIPINTMRRRIERARNERLIAKKRDENKTNKGAADKPIN